MTTTTPLDTGPVPTGPEGEVPPGARPSDPGGRDRLRWVAAGAGLVALVCAVLLPLLPVEVSRPEVSWPADPDRPRPTALQLTTQRPLTLDVRFDCATARAAAGTGGVVLATMSPRSPEAAALGLLATARDGELTVTSRGVSLLRRPLDPGPCAVAIRGDLAGMVATVDGVVVGSAPGETLPDVDVLTTSAPPDPTRAPEGLAVRLGLDDQFDTTPTTLKIVTTALLLVAVLVTITALVARDRSARPRPAREPGATPARGPPRPGVVDLVVPAVIVAWAFLAPMTDDDGYYSAMAGNVPYSGYVANYYQLYNQGFTPFTWIYYALSWWQSTFGAAPVVLRVPATVLGIVTWILLRQLVHRALPGDPAPGDAAERSSTPRHSRELALRVALAVCFLGWWLPFDMGVRPEAVVALSVVVSMLALSVAVETGRWAPVALAVGAASFGVTAAPTGFVALAPLLAGAPAVWRTLRSKTSVRGSVAALVAVVAPGALVGVLAFADGSLRDFLRAQQIFLGMQEQETWYSEITRWTFLLADDDPMGNYAKRAPVLLGVLAVVAFLVLAGRGYDLPGRFRLVGWTTLLGFALLWLTPSKWTHHFGTLAGAGGALLALVVVGGPLLLRERPPRWPAVAGAGLLLAVVIALAGHGTNDWPYSWMLGVPHARSAPQVGPIAFDQPAWWLLGMAVVAGAVIVLARRRAPGRRPLVGPLALAVTVLVALSATTGYMVGGFALAAHRTASTWSPWADAVQDPLERDGVAASAMEVLDPASARPLPPAPGLSPPPAPGPFVPGGWFPGSPPPAAPGIEARGSFVPAPAIDPALPVGDDATGEYTSPWYAIPTDRAGAAMTASVAGRTGDGNELRVEYARTGPDGEVVELVRRVLGEDADSGEVDSTVWRALLLEVGNGPPPGATMLRLVARDTSTAPGGWLAVTAPSVQRWTPLPRFLSPADTVAVSWQFAFLFPGLRTPVQAHGVNEPVTAAVVWGDEPLAYRADGIFQPERGGLFAQSVRESEVTEVVTRLRDFPDASSGQVYVMRPYVADGAGGPDPAYRLDVRRETVSGASPAPNTTFSEPVEPGGAGEG